ncbi:Bug family tripartite tricarboxylate transporter substrate binding protein, partial [Pseudochelatococcus sp. B33]
AVTAIGLGLAAWTAPVTAQAEWPERPVEVIVPWAAGGGSDALARIIFEPLAARLGQAFPLDFRPGAVGTVGTAVVALNAAPDGHTLLFTSGSPIIFANFMPGIPYKPQEDLIPIIETFYGPTMMVAHINTPYNTFQEFVDYAKANPGKVNLAFNGVGGNTHALASAIQLKTGAELNLVPYSGVADQLADLLSGTVDVGFGYSPAFVPGVEAGRLKFIAAMSSKRNPALPDIGASEESEYKGLYRINSYGVFARKGTPPEVIEKINAEIQKTLRDPAVRAGIEAQGFFVVEDSTPEQFASTITQDVAQIRELIESGSFQIGE